MKKNIRSNITLMVLLGIALILLPLAAMGYLWGHRLLKDVVGDSSKMMARLVEQSLGRILLEEITDLHNYASESLWKEEILKHDAQYQVMSDAQIQDMISDYENRWPDLSASDPDILKYLNSSRLGRRLTNIAKFDDGIGEIFVADLHGGLVAASEKTSDFYQADEDWWQQAYDNGAGQDYIGQPEFDESSRQLAIPIAFPVRDIQGRVTAVCKAVMNINRFFEPLKDFKIGASGRAGLINSEGLIIFHPGTEPLKQKYCTPDCIKKLTSRGQGWVVLKQGTSFHPRPLLTSVARVRLPLVEKFNLEWFVVVDQDYSEVFAPLDILMRQLLVLCVFALMLSIGIGRLTAIRISIPIEKIKHVVSEFGKGHLSERIRLSSQDELRDLAGPINQMAADLQKSTTSIDILNREIEERRKTEQALEESNKNLRDNEMALRNTLVDLYKANEELKDTQNQLLQSEKMAAVGQLSAGVAHEIKNPLAIIVLCSEILEASGAANDEWQIKHVRMIKNAAERANKVIVELLNFSRYSRITLSPVKLNKVIESAVSLVENNALIRGIQFRRQYDCPAEIEIDGHLVLLQQVLLNLFTNAIDAIEKDGSVTVRTRIPPSMPDHVLIEVEDTGPGIPPGKINSVFEPFFTTKQQGRGTGLGLSTAYIIIQKHQGTITVESKEHQGAKFTISLPKRTVFSEGEEKDKNKP